MPPTDITDTVEAELPDSSQLAAAFVDLSRAVNDGKDMVEILTMLAERCVQVLHIAACGILVIDPRGELEVIGSSNHSAHLLDLFQVQNVEGPCLECCRDGEPVIDLELSPSGPWPGFAAATLAQGSRAVYPMPPPSPCCRSTRARTPPSSPVDCILWSRNATPSNRPRECWRSGSPSTPMPHSSACVMPQDAPGHGSSMSPGPWSPATRHIPPRHC